MLGKKLLLLLIAILGLTMAACDNDSDDDTTDPTSGTIATAPTTTNTIGPYSQITPQEQTLLDAIRNGEYSEYYQNDTDIAILEAGYSYCVALAAGSSMDDLIIQLQSQVDALAVGEQEAVGYLLGASVASLCPEYLPDASQV